MRMLDVGCGTGLVSEVMLGRFEHCEIVGFDYSPNMLKQYSQRYPFIKAVVGDFNMQNDTIISNARHQQALIKTATSLEKALYDLENNITADFVAMDIRQAMFDLGTITGDISTDDLLGNIFSKFCIGK